MRKVQRKRKAQRANATKREVCIRVVCLPVFPSGKHSVRSPNDTICSIPSQKIFDTLAGVTKPFLSLFFTDTRINPTCRVFRVNDVACGKLCVNLYLKIDIYVHRSADSRYTEDTSQVRGASNSCFFFLLRFRFHSREFVGQQRRLVNCMVYVDNIL